MADESPVSSPPETPASTESKAQEQARLRRERRNAKLQAGGSDRLNKILSSSGREAAAEAELKRASSPSNQSTPTRKPANVPLRATVTDDDDPAEVDISQLGNQTSFPGDDAAQLQEAMIRASLRQPPPGSADSTSGQAPGSNGTDKPDPNDPMVQMMQQMQQMLGVQPGQAGDAMPGLANILQNLQQQGGQPPPQAPDTFSNRMWTIIHAVFSICLGIYALTTFTFTGSELARSTTIADQGAESVFYIFATAELILQSTRYFMEGGRLPQTGILAWAGRLLPDPYGHYARMLSRYHIIYTTTMTDAMMVVFILGAATWWKGMAAS